MPKITIRPALLLRLLGLGSHVVFTDTGISIARRGRVDVRIPLDTLAGFFRQESGLFGCTLIIPVQGPPVSLRCLRRGDVQEAWSKLEGLAKNQLESNIREVTDLFGNLARKDYLRDSSVHVLDRKLIPVVESYLVDREKWLSAFDEKLIGRLDTVARYTPIVDHIDEIRKDYESTVMAERRGFYDSIESNPLTEEQRLAVIRDDDRNLVLAAAGTGKTSVIVAKAPY